MKFRKFLVRYIMDGDTITLYADGISQLEKLLETPRKNGIGWSFRSVA